MALFTTDSKKDKKAAPVRKAHAKKLIDGRAHEIIRAPWFSEKALLATERGVYAFTVPASVTKADVAGAIKEIFKVEPRAVRIANLPGKRKSLRTRPGFSTRAARRKAYVYLREGDTIQFA